MKKLLSALALVAAFATQAQAAPLITGSQGIAALGNVQGNTGNLATDTSFFGPGFGFVTTSSQLGDYLVATNPAGTSLSSPLNLDILAPAGFTIGSAAFGTFLTSSIIDNGFSGNARSFVLLGTFTPGTNLPGLDPNTAQVVLSFTQSGGAGNSYSASATLTTPQQVVPEPATIVMLLTCGGPVGLALMRRRRQRQLAC